MTTVLISGASVAGPALAYLLQRRGFQPTVVERAPALRTGGQAIDIRGVALDVVDRIGVLDEVRALKTHMRGMSMYDGTGTEIMRSTEMALSSGRLDSDDVEILRDDLTRLVHDQGRDNIDYIFGDSIAALTDTDTGVRVQFERGAARTFDLVVGADGLHSGVRRLAFGPEHQFVRHLGTYISVFRAENFLDLDNWQVWYQDGDVGGAVYPVRQNSELLVTLGFKSDPVDYDYRDIQQQKTLMAERLAGCGWEVPRLLKAMWESEVFYFDAMAQVRMDTWSSGRVSLIGDAAYSASPLSGQGTSLALVGAYVLADELDKSSGDHRAAFPAYERRMRPFVELNQALATENPGGPASEESIERAKNAIVL